MLNDSLIKSTDRSPSPDANTVKLYVEHLRELLMQAHESLKDYKRQVELYRSEIETMRHHLETLNSDNMSHLVPQLQHVSEFYNSAIAIQRKESVSLQ